MTVLDRAQAWVADVHPHARHLERTLDWLLALDPHASERARIAAATHDIERAYPDGTVRKARVARQPFAIVPRPEGGTDERPLDPEEGGAQKLDEEQLRALARLGDDLERRLGGPQDIEWAIEGGELYVLQARPVTTS
jgi:hypothetical protein